MTPIGMAVLLVIVAIIIGAVGLPWISAGLIVIALIALIVGLVGTRKGGPREVTQRTDPPDLLGPGGADDPDA
jgi:hypothetical protein